MARNWKKDLGDLYPSQFPEGWENVAGTDNTVESYTTDQTEIHALPNGHFLLATASGCSCWDGDWYVVQYNSLEYLFKDIGPEGEADYEYHPNFKAQDNLRSQVKRWLKKNGKEDLLA